MRLSDDLLWTIIQADPELLTAAQIPSADPTTATAINGKLLVTIEQTIGGTSTTPAEIILFQQAQVTADDVGRVMTGHRGSSGG